MNADTLPANGTAEALLAGQNRVLRLIAAGRPLPQVLDELILFMESQSEEALCSVLLLDDDGNQLHWGAAPSLPVEYSRALDLLRVGPKKGSCGTAAFRRTPVIVTDIATDPLWEECRELALDHGLRACSSSPLLDSEGAVLGTFAFYYRTPHPPSAFDLRLIAISSDLAGIAVERAHRLSRLEEAVSARDTFLAIASHELRTPITTLLFQTGALRLLWKDAEEAIPLDELAPKLALLERQSARLSRLVGELLDVSRLVSGQLDLVWETLDLAEAAREVIARLSVGGEAGCSKIELVTGAPVTVVGDRSRLDQVITNLLSNAMKFGASRPIEVRVEADDEAARLVVRDQGVGIAKENLERVFRKFERVVSARNHGGFGLGLWLCRQMVERMNGRISIASELGAGATVTVELPRAAGR
jgi:signal transduction histidine kinase